MMSDIGTRIEYLTLDVARHGVAEAWGETPWWMMSQYRRLVGVFTEQVVDAEAPRRLVEKELEDLFNSVVQKYKS